MAQKMEKILQSISILRDIDSMIWDSVALSSFE